MAVNRAILWLLDSTFALKRGDVHVFDAFTHPDFPGQRVQAAILTHLHDKVIVADHRRAVTIVIPENRPSRRSGERTSFRKAGLAKQINIGP